jgi:SAM-dependent methyltransferase
MWTRPALPVYAFSVHAVSSDRWQDAQRYERKFWRNFGFERYRRSVDGSMRTAFWARDRLDVSEGDWLDVGVGPLGVSCIHFLGCNGELHVLDPIERVDADQWGFPEPCKALVRYCHEMARAHVGQAEKLDFRDEAFTLVAMENMLDHVEDPLRVLTEARRVLRPDGRLLLAVDTFSTVGEARFRIKAPFVDQDNTFRQAHPHRFSRRELERLVESAGFRILHRDTTTPLGSIVGRGYYTRLLSVPS